MIKMKLLLFVLLLFVTFGISLVIGPRFISPFSMDETAREILLWIRAPRSIVAILIGMGLGSSGAVLQGILRNPLADPYILGISSGASLSRDNFRAHIYWYFYNTGPRIYRCNRYRRYRRDDGLEERRHLA